jgi:putative PEP-CTERM system TPR-repeat lipoprotein
MLISTFKKKNIIIVISTALYLFAGGLTACNNTQTAESLLIEANKYHQKGDNNAAIIQLKNALQKNPDVADSRYLLGTIYNEIGDAQSAEKELRRALSLGMDSAKVLPDIARAMLLQGKYQLALDETQSLSTAKFDATLSNLRGNAYLALNKSVEAKEIFDLILKEQANNPDALLGLAKHALLQKNIASALSYTEQASSQNPNNIDAWLFQADLHKLTGKIDLAIAAYDHVLQLKPNHLSANLSKASININDKKFEAAKANIEAARRTDAGNINVYYTQALLDFNQGKNSPALEALQQVLRVAPEHMPSHLLAGAVQLALGSPPQAEQHLKKYLEKNPENTYARKLLVSALLKSGQIARAITTLTPALNKGVQDAQILALAGEAYMQTKEFAKANEYLTQASQVDPKNADIRTSLAKSNLALGKNDNAIAELEQAISLDAKSSHAALLLVKTHLRLMNYDKALTASMSLEKEQVDNPLIYNLKGEAYLGKKDVDLARTSFEKALALQASFYPAAENLAQLDMRDKNPEMAKKRFTSVLEKDKKNIQAMTALASLAQSQGRSAEATTWLENANKGNPEALPAALLLSAHYLQIGEKTKALTLVQNLQVTNSENPDVLTLLAQAQMANGKQTTALETYHKLSVLQPGSAKVHLHLGTAHMAMQNLPAAAESLKKALSLQPDYLDAQLAQAALELRKDNSTAALAIAKKIQQQKPKSAVGFVMEGDVLVLKKTPQLAVSAYEKALSFNKNGPILSKLHTALKQAGKGNDADSKVTLWLKEHPEDTVTRMYLAGSYLGENKNKEAISLYLTGLEHNPNSPAIMNNLAWAYFKDKDMLALEYAEKAYKISADNPAVMDTLGTILVAQGNATRGLPLLQKAITLAPDSNDIRYHLAQGLATSGDKVAARKELEKILSSGKDFSEIEAAKAMLKQL